MMTLKRFKALTGIYGAALSRWPGELRDSAGALLAVSDEARQALAEARVLDEVIAAADQAIGDQSAAVARLRFAVAAKLAAPPERPKLQAFLLGKLGIAAGGGIAIAAGLLVGWMAVPSADHGALLSLMQPAPFELLAD